MVKKLLFAALFAAAAVSVQAQIIWSEDFESSTDLPAGWTQVSKASDGGWKVGTTADLSSSYFGIPDRAGNVIATNDDGCNCDKSDDLLITPVLDLSGQTDLRLLFDIFFTRSTYQGATETMKVQATEDGGATWTDLVANVAGGGAWREYYTVDIAAYAGKTNVQFGIRYNDGGGWLFGAVLDNMRIAVFDDIVKAKSAALLAGRYVDVIPRTLYGYTHMPVGGMVTTLAGQVLNYGFPAITSYDVEIKTPAGTTTQNVSGLNMTIGQTNTWTVDLNQEVILGDNNILVTIKNVNGVGDADETDNSSSVSIKGIVPAPGRKIVVEEGTGTWCGWCPRGTVMVDFMADQYPNNVIPIAVHNSQTAYPDAMQNAIYNSGMVSLISGFPSGLVDRAFNNVDPTEFEQYALARMGDAPKVVITQNVDFNTTNRVASVTSSFNFKQEMNGDYGVAVVFTEDGVTGTTQYWGQRNYYSGGSVGQMGGWENLPDPVPAADMVYNHVARQIVGGFTGKVGVIPAQNAAGFVMSYTSTFVLPAGYNVDNMHAITLLIDLNSGEIINAEQTPIPFVSTGAGDLNNDLISANIFPNPAVDETTLTLSLSETADVQVRIVDAFGRVVSERNYSNLNGKQFIPLQLGNLSNGMYTLVANAKGQSVSKPFMIAR